MVLRRPQQRVLRPVERAEPLQEASEADAPAPPRRPPCERVLLGPWNVGAVAATPMSARISIKLRLSNSTDIDIKTGSRRHRGLMNDNEAHHYSAKGGGAIGDLQSGLISHYFAQTGSGSKVSAKFCKTFQVRKQI